MKPIEKNYLKPFILVTSLFLLWGLANNMTDTLLAAFKRIMSMSDAQTSLIQFAFYGAYFCLALPAALFIRKHSYKSGVILGLCLYAAGAILFMPAAKAASYGFYLVAIYIMAGGCSVLETTANPYILSMGSPETATRRLNIALNIRYIDEQILYTKRHLTILYFRNIYVIGAGANYHTCRHAAHQDAQRARHNRQFPWFACCV